MKLKITIDEKEIRETVTDYTQHRLREILSLLSTPHEMEWKQKVRFETEEGGITIRTPFPQSMDFWVFLVNNV
jgi:hypothetical protein